METALIAIISLFLASVLIYIVYNNISKKYLGLCPKCHNEFRASPKQLIFTTHAFDEFNITCPHCGFHGMIPFNKIKKEKES